MGVLPCIANWLLVFFFFKDFVYLFSERGEGGRKRGRETLMCETSIDWLLFVPKWWSDLQPRHVPWQGIKLVTFQFAGWRWIHWATNNQPGLDIKSWSMGGRECISMKERKEVSCKPFIEYEKTLNGEWGGMEVQWLHPAHIVLAVRVLDALPGSCVGVVFLFFISPLTYSSRTFLASLSPPPGIQISIKYPEALFLQHDRASQNMVPISEILVGKLLLSHLSLSLQF